MNLTIFLLSYVLIVFSVLGYGLLFQNVLKKTIDLNFEYSFLGALFFLIFLSYTTHFFISHNYIHNLIIFILGLIFFLIFFFKKKQLSTQYSKIIFSIFGILIVAFLTAKTHDDFSYYHFPYTYYLTQEKLIIGIGNLNHGFRTPSSIFYLNSLFYLPFVKFYFFQLGAILLLGASNLILILKMKNDYENKTYDFIFFLTLLSFLFINIFFYRISEHGTDRTAQILIFILLIEILSLFRNTILLEKFFTKIFILLGIIISLKAFYTLYLLLLFPVFFYLRKINFKKLAKIILKNFYFYIFILIGILLIIVNIFNSGCLLYPISFTCFSNFEWSLYQEATLMNDWYEQWSKGGAGPNFRVEDPENYIKGFNWVQNWIDVYFFNKVADFLAGLFFLIAIFFLIFYSKNKKKVNNNNFFWIYFILIILLFEWFYNHPSLRYGGYSLISLIIFIPFSTYISKFTINKYLKKKIIFLILISLIIFSGRNINRINKEIKKYDYDLISNPTYIILKNNHFRINLFISKLIENYENCDNINKTNCDNYDGISIGMKKNYYYLTKTK